MDTDKLIRLVHVRRGLWDREHPAHRSVYAVNALWEEVAQELNSTIDDARIIWQTLRHNFSKRMRRMRMRGCGVDDLKFVDEESMQRFRSLYFLKSQFRSTESVGHIPPEEKRTSGQKYKNSRDDQTGTRDEKVETSKLSKFDGVPADVLNAETDSDTSVPLSPNEEQAALNIDWHTRNHITRRLYETDVGNALPEIKRPILKVRKDGHKAHDEDISFFESLIPHVKGLSPAMKMLLRLKTQELIYNFVYNQK
ncbi:hypothetical protein B7P43_G11715, partial [Cryptotermes secundus]